MTRVILDIRDDRGRFVTRLHPDERTFALWAAAAAVKGMTVPEFVKAALVEYLDQFEPAPEGVGPKPVTCPGCQCVDAEHKDDPVYGGPVWCVACMKAAGDAGDDPRSVGPCY